MSSGSDTHWILFNESDEWRSVKRWRSYVEKHAGEEAAASVADLPVELLYFVGWQIRRARLTGSKEGEYKRFLRAVGGAGDSDWYNTKAEMEYAVELEELYVRSIPEFARGDLGASQDHFDRFVRGYRKIYEKRNPDAQVEINDAEE